MALGRIAIVGSGAVGLYYGARLAQAGEDVTFLLRSDYDHVKQHGIEVHSVAGDFKLESVQCVEHSEEIGEVDLVIVAWKATANAAAKEVIDPLLGEQTVILTLQNGLGNAEHLAHLFGAQRVIGGLCFVCINRLSSGCVSHTASGLIRVGEFVGSRSKRLEEIAKVFNQAQFPCEVVDSLEKALWMKLVWNYPFNGLSIAEGGVDTEWLLKELGLEERIRSIMGEVVSVAEALGHAIPPHFIDTQINVTYPMGQYRPSSMLDFMEGRAVEYAAIWQKPLEVARDLGVPVPEMEKLAAQVAAKIDD